MLYSYIKNKQHVKTGITSIKNKHGAIVTRPMEVVDSLNSHFKSVFGKEEDEFMPYFENRTTKCCPIPVITEHEVYKRLVELDIYKSIGVDGVNPHVLLNCAQSLSKPLCFIFNHSLISGVCPIKWKQANITPIFKKGTRLDPGNYRPVSLTSIVCKILEKIIREVIVEFLTTNNLINSRQHGFMKKKACVTNLLETLDFLTNCYWKKIPVVIAFIDFLKAFDLVAHKRLIFKLSRYGIKGSLLEWIASFLTERTQRVVMGDTISAWESVTSGVPQGSVLGPILFIIFINEISEILISINELYADDTKLIKDIKSDFYVKILQEDIDKIVEWTRVWLMKLNDNKCKIMYIGGGEKNIFTIESYDGASRSNLIETKLEKDLGIMISSDMKWKQHVM